MKSGKFYWETQNNQTAAKILGIADTAQQDLWMEIFLDLMQTLLDLGSKLLF